VDIALSLAGGVFVVSVMIAGVLLAVRERKHR
jgi:hypothetical protein